MKKYETWSVVAVAIALLPIKSSKSTELKESKLTFLNFFESKKANEKLICYIL